MQYPALQFFATLLWGPLTVYALLTQPPLYGACCFGVMLFIGWTAYQDSFKLTPPRHKP